jgi:hypothetical protein
VSQAEERVPLRPFGADSRRRMLEEYFAAVGQITPGNAWEHVYRLLLWIDRTTGLAHCYESDKAQPGRPWYGRSLAFHGWVAAALGGTPADLGEIVDWLFKRGTELLAAGVARQRDARLAVANQQRAAYEGLGFPLPGEDAGLEAIVRDGLGPYLAEIPPPDVMRDFTERLRGYLGQENRRKNLVGEGFEDVLSFLTQRLPGAAQLQVLARPLLHSIPGFRQPPRGEKPRRVDLAIIRRDGYRILVSVKWSVRADREEQFGVDFEAYARLESAGQDFGFVLVTNEFDAARLVAACERRRPNANLFSEVVHVNPAGPLAAYGPELRRSARRLAEFGEGGRLSSLEWWLQSLTP